MERMRGLNLGGWFSQIDCIQEKDPERFSGIREHMETFIGRADLGQIRAWGFDHVRLPVDYFNFFTGSALYPQEWAFELLDRAIAWMQDVDLRVILDLHKCPGHDFHSGTMTPQAFFSDPVCRADAKKVWTYLAERYGGYSHVLLEILNEPVAPDAQTWNRVKDEMFAHIRAHAPRSVIVVGSNRWNSAAEFSELTPVDDDRVIYSFHCYTPVVFTHQLAPWIADPFFQQPRSWPGEYAPPQDVVSRLPHENGRWDIERLRASLRPALEFRERYRVPVACNEFGVYVQVERNSRLRWLGDMMTILREADIGYTYWNYKNLDFGVISEGEKLHRNNPEYNANPQHRDDELLALLIRG